MGDAGGFARTGGRKKAPPPGASELAARFAQTAGPGGFMGASWDSFVPPPILWREVFRVCKPGAIILCFAATRTDHWMKLSLALAGFEILDTLAWLQAQGMAKAGTIDKKIDARNGDERPVVGKHPNPARNGKAGTLALGGDWQDAPDITAPGSAESAAWAGWSTQLAPGFEPIIVARRPCEGTAVANVLKHGCGAMNIDACRIHINPTERDGRWPKNVLLDPSAADVLDLQVGERKSGSRKAGVRGEGKGYGGFAADGGPAITGSSGKPSRYFWVGPMATEDDCAMPGRYVPKVRTAERHAGLPEGMKSGHPTVKPQALMEWLCRLVGHPKGRGLDPFAGSGSTLRAARNLGLAFDGIERDPAFAEIARHRAGVHGSAESPAPDIAVPAPAVPRGEAPERHVQRRKRAHVTARPVAQMSLLAALDG
jgi:hypothetical protein